MDVQRIWWIQVSEELLKIGGKTIVGDESMVFNHFDCNISGILSIYADDFQMVEPVEF